MVNFTPEAYRDYRIKVPFFGPWREVLNTDSEVYGGSNIGRAKTVYRNGLSWRYGRRMQTISGIHYNWSLPGLGNVYRCVPAEPHAAIADPPLRWWSRGEVADLRWVDPATLTAAEWRYGERVESLKHALSSTGDRGRQARPRD